MRSRADSRPSLLVLTTDCPPSFGGIQRIIHELGCRLTPRWEVTVIAPNAEASHAYDNQAPFRVVRTRSTWGRSRLSVLSEMTRVARATPTDLALAAHVNALGPLVSAARGRPLVAIVHGSELWAPHTQLVTRTLGRRLRRVMAVSRFTAVQATRAGIPAERIVLTPLGASVAVASSEGDAVLRRLNLVIDAQVAPYFVTVARLCEPHKGQDLVIRALPSLLRRNPRVRYMIAGKGPLEERFSALADRLGVAHAVHFLGPVNEAVKSTLLRNCRAFVMVSREVRRPALFEGFGIAYLEAALVGRPSLGGRAGGASDAVVDGETGLLVNPLSVAEITKALLRLLEDPDYADSLGRRARERATANYTWERAIERMEVCLESVSR